MRTGCVPVVDCGPPPVVFYSVRDTSIVTTYGSSVKITCLSGFWLRNGVFSATFRCSDQATWQPAAGHCMGKSVVMSYMNAYFSVDIHI